MKTMLKIVLLLVFGVTGLYANKADESFKKANVYFEQHDYKKALEFYIISYKQEPTDGTAYNLGVTYDELKDYPNATKWYKKAFEMGGKYGGFNLAILYKQQQNYNEAIKWYKKTIAKGHISSIKNLGNFYKTIKHDNLLASAYFLALIGNGYTKEETIDYLKNDWKIDEATLKKAYELQLTLVPNPYTGGID